MFDQALEGVKVLDLTQYIAGPYCTKLMADYGADVIKVERPDGGDPARRLGPFYEDDPHHEKSGLFLYLNTNKRSVTLNLKVTSGLFILHELVKEADILVENYAPGVMDVWGLGYDALSEINPRLVMTSISNFGESGPYRDYKASELVLFGMGGEMHSIGMEGREPLKQGGNVAQYEAGAAAAAVTMGALWAADRDDEGQHLDISIFETQLGGVDRRHAALMAYAYSGRISVQQAGWAGPAFASGTLPCKGRLYRDGRRGAPIPQSRQDAGQSRVPARPQVAGARSGRRPRAPGRAQRVLHSLAYGAHQARDMGGGAEGPSPLRPPLFHERPASRPPVHRQGLLDEARPPPHGPHLLSGRSDPDGPRPRAR